MNYDEHGPVSVIVPAHNEQTVIGRCLASLLEGSAPGEVEVVVVCNGCTDETVRAAREAAPGALVLESPVPSKVAALNLGDEHAHYFPRFYVDADVELPVAELRSVAAVLRQGTVHCAAPAPRFASADRPWAVRAFYDVWLATPYHAEEMVGTGVYALSEQGRARFEQFPEITADDQFVQQLFTVGERKAVREASFVVHPPRTLRGVAKMRARVYRGNRELAGSGLAAAPPPAHGGQAALALARRTPSKAPAVAVYVGVNVVAKALARRNVRWERDDSARQPAPGRAAAPSPPRPDLTPAGRTAAAPTPGSPAKAPTGTAEGGVCYVTSHYPALSHTFVMREVLGVRESGVRVITASVHRADPAHILAEVDRRELESTWDIFPLDKKAFLAAHLKAALRHPRAYARTMAHAWRSSPPGLRARIWQLIYFAESVLLWDHAKAEGVEHFHAHLANVASDISWLAAYFGRAAEPGRAWRWSFTMHGPTEFFAIERFNLGRKVAEADAVVCISEFNRSQMMYVSDPQHWGKLRVVHCGADLERYPYLELPRRDYVSVLCVCRMVPEKGLDLLVEAVGELRATDHDVRLVLVGSGPLEAALRRKVASLGLEGSVEFAGAVGQDDMPRYYAEADLFCLPSFAEGVPVVMMEAMATGRAVVGSRITGVPELVEDGVSGLIFTAGNGAELTAALSTLVRSPELRERFGRAARATVEAGFDSRRNAAELAAMFKHMAGTAGDAP